MGRSFGKCFDVGKPFFSSSEHGLEIVNSLLKNPRFVHDLEFTSECPFIPDKFDHDLKSCQNSGMMVRIWGSSPT